MAFWYYDPPKSGVALSIYLIISLLSIASAGIGGGIEWAEGLEKKSERRKKIQRKRDYK